MIQLLIEPSYGANLWAQAYLAGIREEARKRGWELQTLTEEAEAAEEPVLLVGSAVGWLKSRLARLAARNLPCLIAGVPPQGVRCGFAAPDYEEAAAIFAKAGAIQPIVGLAETLEGDNKMFYSIYDNGAKAALGSFAATEAIEGLDTRSVWFDPVNSLVTGDKTEQDWIDGVKAASDQLRAALK